MAQIPRIEDTYIDLIIKSAGAYQPSLIKTQGVKLRELMKLFRDRFEQEITTSTNNYYNKSETDVRYPLKTSLGSFASRNTINGNEVYTDGNYSQYDIGTAQVLRWKNYGNAHVIFDASAGTSPSGSSISNVNPINPWVDTYPTLMGWNGTHTYGVRVDSSRNSDKWNEQQYDGSTYWSGTGFGLFYDDTVDKYRPAQKATVQSWLGLGSASHENADFLMRTYAPYIGNSSGLVADFRGYGGLMTFAYSDSGSPTNGTMAAFSGNFAGGNYSLQLQGGYVDNTFWYRNRNGDTGTWNAWNQVFHTGNVPYLKNSLGLGSAAYLNTGSGGDANTVVTTNANGQFAANDIYIGSLSNYISDLVNKETLQSVRDRNFSIYSTDNSNTSYTAAAFQIRETSQGGGSSYLAPRMAFHWSGVVASQIGLEANGRIAILNNPGTAYEGLNVGAIQSDAGVMVSAGYNVGFGLEDGFSIVRRPGYTGFNYRNTERMAITPTGIVVQGEGYFSNGLLQVNNVDTAIPTLGAAGGSFRMTSHAVYGLYAGVQSSGDVFMQVQRNDGDPTVYNLKLQPNGGNINIGSSSSAVSKLNIERSVAGNFKGISITNGDVNNGSGTSINMGFQAGTTNPYGIRLVQSGNPTQTKSGSFDIQSSTGNTDDTWTSRLLINATGKVYIGTTEGGEQLNVGGWINTVGTCGWFNGTYQGGIYMTDPTWVRVYNTKAFLVDNQVRANGFVNADAGFGFKSHNFRGMIGNYDIQGNTEMMIWTIGDQWNEISTHYGIGYQYHSKYAANHQIVFKNAGVTHASINLENGNAHFDGTVYASSGFGIDGNNTVSVPEGSPMTYVGYHGHSFRTLNNSQIAQIGNGSNSLDSVFNGRITAPVIKINNQLIIPTSRPSNPERGSIWIE